MANNTVVDKVTGGTLTADEFNNVKNSANTKTDPGAVQTTGTALTFLIDRFYGTIGTPETGNITASSTNAVVGVTNVVIHNNGTAPSFDNKFKILSGSGAYVTGVINYIVCMYVNSTEIVYSINQRT